MGEKYEAIIIGGGPAGLTAGIYLTRERVKALLLEKMVPGGTPLNAVRIENYPGFPSTISGRELMDRFVSQAKGNGLEIVEFQEVIGVKKEGDLFTVETAEGFYETYGLIVAVGTIPLRLGIPGEEEYVGRGVSFCATCDGPFFKDGVVAVIGGGDSAFEEALFLANMAKSVYIIHRRDAFKAQKVLQERASKNERISFFLNRRPVEIRGKEYVKELVLENVKTGEREIVNVDGVFVYVGSKPATSFLGELIERDENGFILTDENMSTKTEGLYAAGDVRKKTLRQISTAVADGALAAFSLTKYLLEMKIHRP